MYSQLVIEHFTNPRNVGTIENPDGFAQVGSPVGGDMMELYIKVEDGKIAEIKYRTFGCAAGWAALGQDALLQPRGQRLACGFGGLLRQAP
mgnify:CR=1 FL=1